MTHRARTWLAAPILLFVTATAVAAEILEPHQIRQSLFAACLVGDGVGWTVGELGRILRTENGGATWTRQDAGTKKPFLALGCLDAQTAWIGGKSAILYATKDGGATWDLQTPNTTKHIFNIKFIDRSHGLVVGDWGLIMRTEDGGARWEVLGIPEDFKLPPSAEDIGLEAGDIILYGLAFPDAAHGWTVGEFGTILATADGGRTWSQQQSPVESTLFGVWFASPERGWAVGIDSVILRTDNGGITWRQMQAPIAQRSYYDIAVAGQHGWIAGSSGTVLKTRDGGETWQVEPLPIELAVNWFRSVALAPGGKGLIVGADGLLFATEGDALHNLRSERARVADRGSIE
jgi:photosystem II stability/assembly factor-like uncharacterized protein